MIKQIFKFIITVIRYFLGTIIIVCGIIGLIYFLHTIVTGNVEINRIITTSFLILLLFGIGTCFFLPEIKQSSRKKGLRKFELKSAAQLKPYLEAIVFKKSLPTITPSIFLKENEEAYLEEFTVFSQPKSHTIRYGGAVRVAKGVYIGGTLPQHVYAIVEIDRGKLILTNKRIIFNGDHTTKTINLEEIISVDVYENCISIAQERKEKEAIFLTDKPMVWKVLIHYLKTGNLPPEIKIDSVIQDETKIVK